jgi:hypothetical protein
MREGEEPETWTFEESSSWGVWNGTIKVQEREAGSKKEPCR